MDAVTPLEAFLADRSSGAAELAARALDLLEEARATLPPARVAALARRLVAAHPAMGSIWNAAHAKDPDAFRRALERGVTDAALRARAGLPRRAKITTLSYSSTVLQTLSRRDLRVTVLESLPGGEGRRTARLLRRRGVAVQVVEDSMAARVVGQARFVVVGADAVTTKCIVNKVGTLSLALAARHHGVPVIVVADRTKWVPDAWRMPERGRGTRLFEVVPRRLVTRVVSERG